MSDLSVPRDVLCLIIQEIVDTPAVFIFDIQVGSLPYPPVVPRGCHVRFYPIVNPPGGRHRGTYESQVSKTIRSLLLTEKWCREECLRKLHGIRVPTVSSNAIVRFNPEKHVICLNNSRFQERLRMQEPRGTLKLAIHVRRQGLASSWVKEPQRQLTEIDFAIKHLAFMDCRSPYYERADKYALIFLRLAFPEIQRIYGTFFELPRKNPSEPIGLICPALDSSHIMSPLAAFFARWSLNPPLRSNIDVPSIYRNHAWADPSELDVMQLT